MAKEKRKEDTPPRLTGANGLIESSRLGLTSPEPIKIRGSATYGETKGSWCVVTGGPFAMRAVDGAQPLRRALAHAYQWVSPIPQGTKARSGGQSGFPHKEKTWPRRCKGCKWAVACHGHLGSHDAYVRIYESGQHSQKTYRRGVI